MKSHATPLAATHPASLGARALKTILALLLVSSLAACGGSFHGGPGVSGYTVSGTVHHLDTGGLTISDGQESIVVGQGATTFAFTRPVPSGASYAVTATAQSPGETCVVDAGSGVIAKADVGNVSVVCNTALLTPTAVGVAPVGSMTSTSSRVFLPIGMVGDNPVSINAILDTGSAGVVLNAFNVFPSSIVTANGFVFPPGQTTITYHGISVTNVMATKSFGPLSPNPTEDIGNLGFAQLTFGSGDHVTTAVIPILFVYQFMTQSGLTAPNNFTDLVGINPDIAALTVGGVAPTAAMPLSRCTLQSTTTCGVSSPLRALTYSGGLDKGYVLNQVTLADCSISTAGSCPIQNALVLGLDSNLSSGFNTTTLSSCRTITTAGLPDEKVCSQVIANVTFASGGASFAGPAVFDSGAPEIRLEAPQGSQFPATLASGSVVTVTTPSGFSYQFEPGTGYLTTQIDQNAAASAFSNSGIDFFTQHALLVDYSQSLEGWR